MEFELEEIKNAYKRLKTYIYYDNSDILLRRRLVEFETDLSKNYDIIFDRDRKPYLTGDNQAKYFLKSIGVDNKLERFTEELNKYSDKNEFFNFFLGKINVDFYPKKYHQNQTSANFITNKRIKKEYPLERLTAFIDAPIEIHLIATLWTIRKGVGYDARLLDNCIGNRLLLNKEKKAIVQGSGLFKPYFKQYQKWRDDSVKVAQELLNNDKDVLFLNLDVKDYFHSVRIPNEMIHESKFTASNHNIEKILLEIHHKYTLLIAENHKIPYDFKQELEFDDKEKLKESILPIGLLSSYVLANYYLHDFDKRITEKYKPAYYGRYVDDILIVLSDPNPNSSLEETNIDFKFNFSKYKKLINSNSKIHNKISFSKKDLNVIEHYILSNLSPLLNLVDSPFNDKYKLDEGRVFKINGKKSLFCQSEKTLLYHFDSEESEMVIDKLKKELEERTSEFRDLPNHENSFNNFENNAYHLHYTGTEGKIRTLKDYKENRYGLTLYLSNQIFSTVRHRRSISDKEKSQVLKFFKGETCLIFYRLWERIFTFFLVNEDSKSYVEFYLHCAEQVDKIGTFNGKVKGTNVRYEKVRATLAEYLDCAHELTISLNPYFLSKFKEVEKNFEFKTNELQNSLLTYFFENRFTKNDSIWKNRFRETNMIRHQYVLIPLLNFTKGSKRASNNLIDLDFNIESSSFELDVNLIKESPRPLKYWECCMATIFELLSKYSNTNSNESSEYVDINILGPFISTRKDPLTEKEEKSEKYYLDLAFDIYLQANSGHLPSYVLRDDNLKNNFFNLTNRNTQIDKDTRLNEFRINSNEKLNKPKISFANTEVLESNIVNGIRNTPNLSRARYEKLTSILNKARKEESDIVVFPEFFLPINLFSSLVQYSIKNQALLMTGLEHVVSSNTAFNFIGTILPVQSHGINDATIIFRLKNHYAYMEEELIKENHSLIPKPKNYRYDIINWKNIYFSNFYCFELADLEHRSLLRSKIDLLIAIEWNKDTPYFSNIVESGSRDLHCYIAQVNTSQYGDTRLTQPTETATKDILKLKGGKNDTILVSALDISKLREFQRKKFSKTNKEFKPLPPNFNYKEVLKRISNKNIT